MCSVELPFSLILDNVMQRHRVRATVPAAAATSASRSVVRRALFADKKIDHEATARFLAREFAELHRDARDRWNYDFQNDKPLQGRFEWQHVGVTTRSQLSGRQESDPKPSLQEKPRDEKTEQKPAKHQPATQRKLTDYLSHRKRSSSAISPVPSKLRKSSASATVTSASSPAAPTET